jgi:hypothetical protein
MPAHATGPRGKIIRISGSLTGNDRSVSVDLGDAGSLLRIG